MFHSTIIATCLTILTAWPFSAVPQGEQTAGPLDGLLFEGKIRATGIFGLVAVRGTLSFDDGMLSWVVRGGDSDEFPPARYVTVREDGRTTFRSRMPGRTGDHVEWSGIYDGDRLHDVVARWHRVEGDFIHDLLLPDVVTLRFRTVAD